MYMSKRKLLFTILTAVVGIFAVMGIFVMAGQHSGFFKTPSVFQMIYDVSKITLQFTYGFIVLFGGAIWSALTQSWISVLVVMGVIAFFILQRYTDRMK